MAWIMFGSDNGFIVALEEAPPRSDSSFSRLRIVPTGENINDAMHFCGSRPPIKYDQIIIF